MTAVTVAELHRMATAGLTEDRGGLSGRDDYMGKGLHFGGLDRVGTHWLRLRSTGTVGVRSEESMPPIGQAALWLKDVERFGAPPSAAAVAFQVARLCGEDSVVSISDISLSDAVGRRDSIGRTTAFMESGVAWLVRSGWLEKRVTGRGCVAKTTYFLSVPD